MILTIARKEVTTYVRSGVFISLAVAIVALLVAAAALSAQRMETYARERASAEMVDRDVWDSQGEKNPHAAAHFARYAFKPIPRLVAFDPGITDYAGIALWLEAHYQNPAVFRRAEDLGDAGRLADLSPAWVLQFAAPLFIFLILYSAVSGERESGVLRQIATTNARPRDVLLGKLLGVGFALGIALLPALALALWILSNAQVASVMPDMGSRTVGLVILYAAFLAAVGAFAIGVSALFKEKRSALIFLSALWAVSFVMLPRVASGVGVLLYPQPDPIALSAQLSAASKGAGGDAQYQTDIKKAVLAEYNVESVEALPISYLGYTLQKAEEYSFDIFERIYRRMDAQYDSQESVMRGFAILSPVMSLRTLSSGLAGADRLHQNAFRDGAELHRRASIKLLNDDLMLNGKGQRRYAAGADLWSQIKDFTYAPPRFTAVLSHYAVHLIVVALYVISAFWFALWSLKRAHRRVAA